MNQALYAAAIGTARPVKTWPPPPREPLPAWPRITETQPSGPQASCWTRGAYDFDLPFAPPSQPAIDFHRGNFCAWLPKGVTRVYPDIPLILTWDLVRMSAADQERFLADYAGRCGYTHLVLSIPQTKNFGKSLSDLLDSTVRAKYQGLFVTANVFGGDGESWGDVEPWLDALVATNTVDILCVAWQGDKAYSPMDLCALTFQCGAYANAYGLKVAQHWINDACAWWNPADEEGTWQKYGIRDRFTYQQKMSGVVDYHYYQCDVDAPINDPDTGGIQWSLAKVLQSLTTQKLVLCEYDAQAAFDNPSSRPEAYGDLKGYLGVCSRGFGRVIDGGYLGGARKPSGAVL